MVFGLLNHLQIFLQLYLVELLGLLAGLGPSVMAGVGVVVFFTNLSLMEFQARYLDLFFLFSVIDGFNWFWMGSLHKNIQLMLDLLKGPFLVLHFSYYRLMNFLMMLSVILLSMLMMLLSVLSIQASDLWQQLELTGLITLFLLMLK